jgi:hypothetical protein
VPVSVLDPGASTVLEIELTNACVVRLRGAVDPPLLQAAIAAALVNESHGRCMNEEELVGFLAP